MENNNNNIAVTMEEVNRFKERGYTNIDILPKVENRRNMTLANYFTLWMGSIHNIPNYAMVAAFMLLGLSTLNTMVAIALSGLAVAGLMMANGRAGAKYGIPFAMHLRSTYGDAGAKLPGFLRGVVAAIAWFGVQTYFGSKALLIIIGSLAPGFLNIGGGATFLGMSAASWISFIIFWLMNMAIGLSGGEVLNKFTAVLTPIIYIVFGGMTIWAIRGAGGLGAIFNYVNPATTHVNPLLGYLIMISGVLSVWAAPGASVADFTQNAKKESDSGIGQAAGLFVGHALFGFMAVSIFAGGNIIYNTNFTEVLDIINSWDTIPAVIIATAVFVLSTISTNATGNIIPAGYQLSALFPDKVDYRRGVMIAGIISVIIMPWKFAEGEGAFLTFLSFIGALLGPVAGVMIADFYLIKNQQIDLDALYFDPKRPETSHFSGINRNAYIATIVGLLVSVIGQFIPALSVLADLSWMVGFATALVVYTLLQKDRA